MRPCTFITDKLRAEIASQTQDFINNMKYVEHFDYLVKSQDDMKLERRADGTLTGKCNNRLFEK